MQQILVLSKKEAEEIKDAGFVTHVVSILDENDPPIKFPDNVQHLHITFIDSGFPLEGPKRCQIEEILNWVKEHIKDDSVLLVHCHAGISRSTATAIAILTSLNGHDVDAAIKEVLKIRKIICPNSLVAYWADSILGMNGKLVVACKEAEQYPNLMNKFRNNRFTN